MNEWDKYKGREQSCVKHYVLRSYLQSLTYKLALGIKKPEVVLTYIDGFSGPWKSSTEDLSDTSFQIAINELRKVRDDLSNRKNLKLRCLFVEKDNEAFDMLKEFASTINDIQIELIHGSFEDYIPEIVQFANEESNMFTFTFIDPTGWKGFGMNNIRPLLKLPYSEVLINFMTDFIIRFIDAERQSIKKSFIELFGTNSVQAKWEELTGRERENAIVETYRQRLKEVGRYKYVADTVILNPYKDRTHYHLIYGTRHFAGLLTFREVERKAMQEQDLIRCWAKQNKCLEENGQLGLFAIEEIAKGNSYFKVLRNENLEKLKLEIRKYLVVKKKVEYESLLVFLERPMIYQNDIKKWISEWREAGLIEIEGLGPRERTPKIKKHHFIIWIGQDEQSY